MEASNVLFVNGPARDLWIEGGVLAFQIGENPTDGYHKG